MKKIFIKIARLFGYEIIDQNNFVSPSLNKELNDDLSIINERSIVLPLGNVDITKKVRSLLIILRMNTEVEIWDQKKKRLFEQPKIEYSLRSINSLIKSIKLCKNKYSHLSINTVVIDDNSNDGTLNILAILKKKFPNFNFKIRKSKKGVGSAHLDIFDYAFLNGFKFLITMDADYTHQPLYICLLYTSDAADE